MPPPSPGSNAGNGRGRLPHEPGTVPPSPAAGVQASLALPVQSTPPDSTTVSPSQASSSELATREYASRSQRPRGGCLQRLGTGRPVERVASDATDDKVSAEDGANRGAISQLQEFVQGAKIYPMPPNCRVLQWDYDTRMAGTSLKFRATVAFLLDGVPHHVAGCWKPSKKLAQRDTAERTLGLFVNRWGELALAEEQSGSSLIDVAAAVELCDDARVQLTDFCERLAPYVTSPPQWSNRWDGGTCQAFVELGLLEVSHTFPGKCCETLEEAYVDVARRVLWYLQCPGYEDVFEPDIEFVRAAAHTIPGPSASWAREASSDDEEQQLAERKTTIMRVQNRLQQAYARQLEAGTSPWYWTFEKDPKDRGWPPLCRATVHVPLAMRTFIGDWLRGQREAQISTCTQISEFLDQEFPRTRG